jgi:hypothetical protein
MLFTLLIGSLTTVVNLAIQVTAIVLIVRHLRKRIENSQGPAGFLEDFYVLGVVLGGLFVGRSCSSCWANSRISIRPSTTRQSTLPRWVMATLS